LNILLLNFKKSSRQGTQGRLDHNATEANTFLLFLLYDHYS
jgi:hypothetical protein